MLSPSLSLHRDESLQNRRRGQRGELLCQLRGIDHRLQTVDGRSVPCFPVYRGEKKCHVRFKHQNTHHPGYNHPAQKGQAPGGGRRRANDDARAPPTTAHNHKPPPPRRSTHKTDLVRFSLGSYIVVENFKRLLTSFTVQVASFQNWKGFSRSHLLSRKWPAWISSFSAAASPSIR